MSLTSANPAKKGTPLSKYLDPDVLNRVAPLEVAAKFIVEGFMAGWHRSPYHGFSVEFAQHREYAMGDDLRHLDWKLFAKSGRYHVKQYEVETNFTAHILHDASESMLYKSPDAPCSKLDYANYLTAALSYMIVTQTDAVGAGIFNEDLLTYLEPKQSPSQVHRICHELEAVKPLKKTDTGKILHSFADRIKRRGMVMLVSDLLDDPEKIIDGLNHIHFRRHEAIVFHVLDPFELEFPFDGQVKFEGLEGYDPVLCQPRMIRRAYLDALNEHIHKIKTACERNKMDYVQLNTGQPLEIALAAYFQSRAMQVMGR